MSSRRGTDQHDRYHINDFSFAGCFNTGVFRDVDLQDSIVQLAVTVTRLEKYASLSELQLFIGQERPAFHGSNLRQDSSRSWLVFQDTNVTRFYLDVLDIRGHAHLALQNDLSNVELKVKEYRGDFTGALHVGPQQLVDVSESNNSLIPFSIQTYQVSQKNLFFLITFILINKNKDIVMQIYYSFC